MQIVWDKEAVAQLKTKHTLLELETFIVNGKSVITYCVIPPEKILGELANLDDYITLHETCIKAFNEKNYPLCLDAVEHLMGRFSGELDSFYSEIVSRIKQ